MLRFTTRCGFGLLAVSELLLVLGVAACSSDGGPMAEGSAGGRPFAGSTSAGSGGSAGSAGKAAATPDAPAGGHASGGTGGALGSAGSVVGGGSSAGASGSAAQAGVGGVGTAVVLPALVTSAPGAYWKTDGTLMDSSAASADVTVNDSVLGQSWEGFGAAFNEQGWSVLTSAELQQQAIRLLFSASDGAAFSWGRIPIGANDYAVSRYTLDDAGSDDEPNADESNRPPPDLALAMFSMARDREKLIPYLKAARAVKPDLRFWASPWTPPVWMKTGYKKSDGWNPVKKPSYYDGGSIKSDPAILGAYAQYFAKFIQGYRAEGIEIELVAPQEEPSFEMSYPSCVWDKATFTTFVGQYLGPAMSSLGVKVMLGTLSDYEKDLTLAAAVLADATAKSVSTRIGAQWAALSDAKLPTLSASLPIWATEHKGGNYPWNPSGFPPFQEYPPNDHAYGIESWGNIRDAISKTKVTSYNAWNLVLDSGGWGIDTSRQWGQNALLVANSGTLTATPAYYVFRHLSQYVVPGATVLGTTGGDALAFKNPDGSLVTVLFNSGAARDDYVIQIAGKKLRFAMPGNGWATVKYAP
ncbi:MAG TPA: glycoside hydrolase family 30 beta sandwich domain-containing protein [Polyangiaceae bacterium]|nr:glycoside hydrolase family 30 beta sandwich domain-containing protein [Polyangiaceae bacterium]